MSIPFFEALDVRFKLSSEEEIANISAPAPHIKKNKDTLLSLTLKLEEKKVSLICIFKAW